MTEHTLKAQDLMNTADRAFDAGDVREGSRLMWEATRTAIGAVATKRGWPCGSLDEIKQVIYRLDGVDEEGNFSGSYPKHFAHFGVAEIFREHAETDEWEYPEFHWSDAGFRMGRKSIKEFIALLEENAQPNGNSW